ncbi:putative scarecrow-like protein 16 [Ananas comosus]|uniref:Putative scarecrow-like protein 16 n=1 Tax=Ananas comosus TaxID=4615 RepID=A0A199VI05_ANACO|nr:putative scarecrow-like protein 16 [Ananas comosus]
MLLHYIPDETAGAIATPPVSLRSMFLKAVRSLEPALVTVADEDADFTATDVVSRLRSAFNYLWIPYDAVDTFLPKGSEQRKWYEAGLGWRIEDVIAREGCRGWSGWSSGGGGRSGCGGRGSGGWRSGRRLRWK